MAGAGAQTAQNSTNTGRMSNCTRPDEQGRRIKSKHTLKHEKIQDDRQLGREPIATTPSHHTHHTHTANTDKKRVLT
jgi:hypothetical protein